MNVGQNRISRRQFCRSSLYATAGAVAIGSGEVLGAKKAGRRTRARGKRQPNIVLIFSDQQHWRAMGFLDDFFDTPTLDGFSEDSCVFERAFCTTPQCSPSRSSILTGCYPTRTGVKINTGALDSQPLRQETIGAMLQRAGYRTAYFGKWHLGDEDIANKGWDSSIMKVKDPLTESSAVEFIKDVANDGGPFALFASFSNPHDIYHFEKHTADGDISTIPLPRSWHEETFENKPVVQKQFMTEDQGTAIWDKERATWQNYRDCYRVKTRLYDDNVGAIVGELKKQGLWENTIVIVTSDHGDMDTNNRLIYKGPFMYEHMVRVPLMIRVPGRFGGKGGKRIGDLDTVNVDITPTILDLCGLDAIDCDGISLKPTLTGRAEQERREFVIGQYHGKQQWVNPIRMIRTEEFKLNRYLHYGDELYDLKNDPEELQNLANDPKYASVKEQLVKKLDEWMQQNNDPFYSLRVTDMKGKKID